MRLHTRRKADSTYELNLAPFLDIIVSIVPMLLLSVAFIQIRMIETSIPQVVAQKIKEQREDKTPKISISLKVQASGHNLVITENGKSMEHPVAAANGQLNYAALTNVATAIKKTHADIFSVDLLPDQNVSYDQIVQTMDAIRRLPASEKKLQITDQKTGQSAETDLMFPDVTFANVVE